MDISKLKNKAIGIIILLLTGCSIDDNYEYEHKLHNILGVNNVVIIDKHKNANFDAHGEWWICEKYSLEELSLDTTTKGENHEFVSDKWQEVEWFSETHNFIQTNIIAPICSYPANNNMTNELQISNLGSGKLVYKLYCFPDTIEPIKVIIVMCDMVNSNVYIIDTKLF